MIHGWVTGCCLSAEEAGLMLTLSAVEQDHVGGKGPLEVYNPISC